MKKLFLLSIMFVFSISWTVAQRTITGTVTDSDSGIPLVGASVLVKGTTVGQVTDLDGKYSLEVPADATTLVYTYVGYQNQEITLGAANVIDISLSEGASLQEVIVTALGTSRESKSLGYAAQQVNGDQLKDANTTNVVDALNGKVAGVQITSSAGTAGASSRIVLRGQTSLDGNNQALFVVDGLRIDNSEFGTDAQSIGTPGTKARRHQMDVFGAAMLAFVTAYGGGTVRDILIGIRPLGWINDYTALVLVVLAVAIVFMFNRNVLKLQRTIFITDAIGLGLFTILGIHKCVQADINSGYAVILGTIGASFGGLIADMLSNTVPDLLKKGELYATACLIGGTIQVLLEKQGVNDTLTMGICIFIVVAIRIVSKWKRISLPEI